MIPGALRIDGTLASWNDARGFGFITPTQGGRDVFVHVSALVNGPKRPRIGEALTFEVELTPEGKRRARMVLPAGASITDRPRRTKLSGRRSVVGYLAIVAFLALYLTVAVERGLPLWVSVLYVGTSIVSFLVYAADKSAAATGTWRTSESTLLAFGIIGGWPGAVIAQQILRHKTRKRNFQLAFWGTVALNIAAFLAFTSPSFSTLVPGFE